jgi:hypothetical protein
MSKLSEFFADRTLPVDGFACPVSKLLEAAREYTGENVSEADLLEFWEPYEIGFDAYSGQAAWGNLLLLPKATYQTDDEGLLVLK